LRSIYPRLTRFARRSYFTSLGLTIYFALGPRWKLATLLAAAVQLCALAAYLA
jgi:hypothetical protein